MRVQHPEQKIDIVGRLRNFEDAFVNLFVRRGGSVPPYGGRIRKSDSQGQFFCDQIDRAQSQRELLQKAAQHEQQRLSRFDFMFEFEALLERLRWLNKFQEPSRRAICSFPKPKCFRAKPCAQLLFI